MRGVLAEKNPMLVKKNKEWTIYNGTAMIYIIENRDEYAVIIRLDQMLQLVGRERYHIGLSSLTLKSQLHFFLFSP